MDEQQLQQQIIQLVLAAMQGNEEANQQIQQIMQAAQQGDQQAAQIAQMIQEVALQMQQQQVQAAKFGAKLNYIKQLRGQCPDGYEMRYFKGGGRMSGQLCKQCVKVQEKGGKAPRQQQPKNVVDQFKCGKKMKKVRKAAGGTEMPTAESARQRYRGGTKGRIENTNSHLKTNFSSMGYPHRTDYDVVVADDGNMIYNPSVIAKGYDYAVGDSVAIERPRHAPMVTRNTASPVYKKNNPKQFKRLSRRVDEAKSVSRGK